MPQLGYHRMTVSDLCKLGIRVVFDVYTVSIQVMKSKEIHRSMESTSFMVSLQWSMESKGFMVSLLF